MRCQPMDVDSLMGIFSGLMDIYVTLVGVGPCDNSMSVLGDFVNGISEAVSVQWSTDVSNCRHF